MHGFGTPDLLESGRDGSVRGTPIAPGIEFATSWEFPSRQALADAMNDATPGRFYPRYGHPPGMLAEARIAQLEHGAGALLYGSGVAAIASVLLFRARSGDRVALSRKCYGGTVALGNEDLPRFGIEVDWLDPFDAADVERVLARGPSHVHVETPVNPTGRVFDLRELATKAHDAGARVSVDATFMPPPFQRTLDLGVDFAIHSATKFFGGHTDLLAGSVSGCDLDLLNELDMFRRRLGPVVAPETAWRLRRSLDTLVLRVRQQNETAARLATWLAGEGGELGVAEVHYPGLAEHPDHALAKRQMQLFGSVFAFEPTGGVEVATRVYDALRVFRRGVSLGGVESLACLPVDTSHHMLNDEQFAGVGFGSAAIRLSVGLEPFEELLDDLAQALAKARAS